MNPLMSFIYEHDNWEELLSSPPYNLIVKRDRWIQDYVLLKYNEDKSDFTLPEVKCANGLIFKESNQELVCHPLNKAFEINSPFSDIKKFNFKAESYIQKKTEGILINAWYADGRWRLSTSDEINAFQAIVDPKKNVLSYGLLFENTLEKMEMSWEQFCQKLHKRYTFIFKFSPEKEQIIFVGLRDIAYPGNSCNEWAINKYIWVKDGIGNVVRKLKKYFPIPKMYPFRNFNEMKKAINVFSNDGEYYITDICFNRIKVTNPREALIYRINLIDKLLDNHLLEIILMDEVATLIKIRPEYLKEIKSLDYIYNSTKKDILSFVEEYNISNYETREKFVQDVKNNVPAKYQAFVLSQEKIDYMFEQTTVDQWLKIIGLKKSS